MIFAIQILISMCDKIYSMGLLRNALRPRQNDRHFADNTIKCIFLNGNVWISLKSSPKFVPQAPIDNIQALVQIMAWHRLDDWTNDAKVTDAYICVTRPHLVIIWNACWLHVFFMSENSIIVETIYIADISIFIDSLDVGIQPTHRSTWCLLINNRRKTVFVENAQSKLWFYRWESSLLAFACSYQGDIDVNNVILPA